MSRDFREQSWGIRSHEDLIEHFAERRKGAIVQHIRVLRRENQRVLVTLFIEAELADRDKHELHCRAVLLQHLRNRALLLAGSIITPI